MTFNLYDYTRFGVWFHSGCPGCKEVLETVVDDGEVMET